jgi:hypothetical protein
MQQSLFCKNINTRNSLDLDLAMPDCSKYVFCNGVRLPWNTKNIIEKDAPFKLGTHLTCMFAAVATCRNNVSSEVSVWCIFANQLPSSVNSFPAMGLYISPPRPQASVFVA